MKKWGSRIVDLVGYLSIGYIMAQHYGIHGWDIFTLLLIIESIQWFCKFVNEIVEY